MAYDPELDEDDESLEDGPMPSTTIAGPQTPRDQVMQRISAVRNPAGVDPERDDQRDAAMQFAKSTALTSGIGRALNALSAGTGYKPDNGAYDALDKQPDVVMKDLARSDAVRKAVADRQAKADALTAGIGMKQSALDLKKQGMDASQALQKSKTDAYNRRTDTMGKLAGSRADNGTIRAANTILNDKNAQAEVKKLQASRSAQSLVDAIRSGEITGSKNVSKQLTNMIATIELGTPGGQGDRAAMGVDTLYGKIKGAMGYLEGKPEGVIPSDYLDQLESETHALGDRAAANLKNITDGALAGADLSGGDPDADSGKVYALAKQRRDILLKNNGYDPETGLPLKRREKPADAGQLPPNKEARRQELLKKQREGLNAQR